MWLEARCGRPVEYLVDGRVSAEASKTVNHCIDTQFWIMVFDRCWRSVNFRSQALRAFRDGLDDFTGQEVVNHAAS